MSCLRPRIGRKVHRYAIAQRELRPLYQPQYYTGNEEPFGFETLLRWRHAEKGDMPPSIFIPLAEGSGLILQIGEWVLRKACQEAASWPRRLNAAVNISAVQLRAATLAQLVHEVLLGTGLPASRLELEITESALIEDPNRALSALRQVKALGVRVAMDDFGTGRSSLSNLRAFPFDKIKTDCSFVKSVNNNEQAARSFTLFSAWDEGLACRCLQKAWRQRRSWNFWTMNLAARCKDIFSADPMRSARSGKRPTANRVWTSN
jgi:EAL domain-containing protein (putative c-di-GMP-specific phosphodiesterase class I)